MPLDPHAIGRSGDLRTIRWDATDALLYAVGLGAGQDDLAFTTENTEGLPQRVFPTFAVMAGARDAAPTITALDRAGTFDWALLVHGAQSVTLHRPIPIAGSATSQDRIVAMYDKGSAAVVVTETDVTGSDGSALWTTRSSAFIRGAGGWGGERGPSGPVNAPPPGRSAEIVRSLPTGRDQAFVYRLSGDRNPLHTDPAFAARGGFERPILHGLCTYGMTGRALLTAYCDDDPARFEHIEARFTAPVYPGDILTVRAWTTAPGLAVFTTSVGERTVIDQGLLRFRTH